MAPRVWDIWAEGYLATGMEGIPAKARLVGQGTGETFREAILDYASRDPEWAKYLNIEHPSNWGCRLYDNETEARAGFG